MAGRSTKCEIKFIHSHKDVCSWLGISATNKKGEQTKISSSNLSSKLYSDTIDQIKTVGGFPVEFVGMEESGSVSRYRTYKKPTDHFDMGGLSLTAQIYGVCHTLDELDKPNMEAFIETLYEWLPQNFLGNKDYFLCPNRKKNLIAIMKKTLAKHKEGNNDSEDDSEDDSEPQNKKIKLVPDIISTSLAICLLEIGRKLAYTPEWNNGPGKESIKSLLDGVLTSNPNIVDLDCSITTHPTPQSQRAYIRDANYRLEFDCGASFDYTSLTDAEVINITTNGAVFVVEVKSMSGGEGQVGVHMLLRYMQTFLHHGVHRDVYGIVASGNMEKLVKVSLLEGRTLTLCEVAYYNLSDKRDLLQLLAALFYIFYGRKD